MRLYDGRLKVYETGEPRRLWDARDTEYDEGDTYQPSFARKLWITASEDNNGAVIIGGKKLVAALSTRVGMPPLLPGASLCCALENVDLHDIWADVTIDGESLHFAYLAEPATEYVE